MATTGFATTMQPAARPSLESSTHDLKGLSRQRMRTSDGKRAASKEDIEKDILKLLATPQTPSMLAAAMHRDPKALYRQYLKPMLEKKTLEKSGDYYKRAGVTDRAVEKQHFEDVVKKSHFAQLPIMEDLVEHIGDLRGHGSKTVISRIWKICTGRAVPSFKCRPEHWTPETTEQYVRAWKDYTGKDRVDSYTRQMLRYIHEYILKKPVTDAQKKTWGIDGKKDKIGQYAHVRMTEGQIVGLAKYFMDKGDLQIAGVVAGGIECFARPGALFAAETAKFQLTERTITKATIQGWPETIYDNKFMPVLQALSLGDSRIRIETFKAPAVEGQLFESKTQDLWPKRVIGAQAVKILTEVLHERRNKPTLFNWQGLSWYNWQRMLGPVLKEGYREIGLTHDYFTKKSLYALRHVGAQMWLGRTMYDYAGIAEMGWRDIATLHRWYGGYSMEFFNQKVAVAYA